ncbi:M20 metallopeptidase family protein [Fusibacter ferrireducens]|uniref:Amidohydrolase n=1 Tax=Fusibacter ferrireducens TaxID=2785058 RepID=A0ABR9ZPW4_9FIRM|nr:amidohydrolase [Fusibacter ferrireducens]MBF4692507.1 amidohydrolase [Fusibacter ferrireducens]
MISAITEITQISDEIENEVIGLRRRIHAYPELSFQEFKTAETVLEILKTLDVKVKTGIAGTGIIADMEGNGKGKSLLLRADMDALPLQEFNQLPFKSSVEGVMHACGHDAHTANLLGVAMIMNRMRSKWSGRIRFVFQPAEERGGGGKKMIDEGILDDVSFDAALALHTSATMSPGSIQVGWENITAYSDKFNIQVKGKKTHSSNPSKGIDAINIAAHIIVTLNSILAKNMDPMATGTFSIGIIRGGSAPNIVADEVMLEGMMRNVTPETRQIMIQKIESIAKHVAEGMGGQADFIFTEGYPSVYNNVEFTNFVYKQMTDYFEDWQSEIALSDTLNPSQIIRQEKPLLGAEDFGFYSQRIPSCFYWVGTGNLAPAHSGDFMIEEKYIKLCLRSMATIAFEYLRFL